MVVKNGDKSHGSRIGKKSPLLLSKHNDKDSPVIGDFITPHDTAHL